MSARYVLTAPTGALKEWRSKFEKAGYVLMETPNGSETRLVHPLGSCARLFLTAGGAHCYIYPPGGTKHQSGPLVIPDGLRGVDPDAPTSEEA